jgi:hypothetical protein
MNVTIIALLCSLTTQACHEVVATEARSMQVCYDEPALVNWMMQRGYIDRGYQLKGWKCQIGARRREA